MLLTMDRNQPTPSDAATTVEHSPEAKSGRDPLVIAPDTMASIVQHLRSWLPNEGCGLLASVRAHEHDRAVHFFPGTNIEVSPVRYTMDPVEVIEAMKRMRRENWQLAAIVHSHPRTQPEPSRTDQQEWYYTDTRLLIVSFSGSEPEFGCWGLSRDSETRGFIVAPLRIEER